MLSVIWSNPDLSEVFFLVAVILFALEVVVIITKPAEWVYGGLLIAAGLLFLALGFLAA
jgi:hypothetical protein